MYCIFDDSDFGNNDSSYSIWANENCENSIAITENAEKDIQDTVTDPRLNYIYVEQPYLESPDTQKIAVSWEMVQKILLRCQL